MSDTFASRFVEDVLTTRAPSRRTPHLLHPTKVAFDSGAVLDMYWANHPTAVELVEALRDVLQEADGGRRPAVDALAFTVNTGTPSEGGWLAVFRVTAPFGAAVRLTKTAGEWEYQVERVSGRTAARVGVPAIGPAAQPPPPPDGPHRRLDL